METAMTTFNGGGYLPAPMHQFSPVQDKYARAQARGWNDVRNGHGIGEKGSFSENYDKWKRKVQFAYERGRFRAVLASQRLAPGRTRVALWKRDMTVSQVLELSCGYDAGSEIMQETGTVRARKEKVRQ